MNYNDFDTMKKISGCKAVDISRATGIASSTFTDWKKGRYIPKQDKIDAITDFFIKMNNPEVNAVLETIAHQSGHKARLTHYETVFAETGDKTGSVKIPILNTVVAGLPVAAYEDILGYEEISANLASAGEFFALKIKGSSMMPTLQEDDIIIVKRTEDIETGDIAIVLINGDDATVKKVVKSPDGITLVAFNPAVYEPHFYSNEDIESLPIKVIGKVMEMKRTF